MAPGTHQQCTMRRLETFAEAIPATGRIAQSFCCAVGNTDLFTSKVKARTMGLKQSERDQAKRRMMRLDLYFDVSTVAHDIIAEDRASLARNSNGTTKRAPEICDNSLFKVGTVGWPDSVFTVLVAGIIFFDSFVR